MTTVEIDQLRYTYLKMKEHLMPETDALKQDLTKLFWETLKDKIDNGELVNIGVRGEVRTGKSTVAIKIAKTLNHYLERQGLNKNISNNMQNYIFSDQTEFLRFINSDTYNICIVIDEFNRMAKTGANATTEEALFDYYSDVFAAKYIHRISCSPDVIADKNANIILDVMGRNNKQKVTQCKLIYRDIITKQHLTLGYVNFELKQLVKNWQEKIEPIFLKPGRTPKQEKLIEHQKNEDFYVRYQLRKYRRLELLEKHGVRDIREPEYASIVIETLIELQDYAKIKKVDSDMITTLVDEVRRRSNRIYSLLAIQEIATRVRAILNVYTEIHRISTKINKLKPEQANQRMIMQRILEQLKQIHARRMQEQAQLREIYDEYINIK